MNPTPPAGRHSEPTQTDSQDDPRANQLRDWWHTLADQDLDMLVPKAVEYSAYDLVMTGRLLADLMGLKVDAQTAAELCCAWYALSKLTRLLGAYKEGRQPSADSITDLRVYATMMARIRECGSWPGW